MKTISSLVMFATVSGVVWLAGCSTPDTRIKDHPEIFAQLAPQEQTLVRAGQVGLGFSAEAVKLALGEPDRITVRTDANGQLQVWHYVESAECDGAFLYGGPYWGGWGARRWVGYWAPYPVGPVRSFDRFRVEFRNNKVVAFSQDLE